MSLIEVHVNCPDADTAGRIGVELVTQRLAACSNIVAPVDSHYWWDGTVQHDREVLVVLKTRRALFDRVVDAVRELHPDEVPCILAHEIAAANGDYARWVHESTAEASGPTGEAT